MAEIGKDIQKAIALLQKGEVIGMPTETVYGLAGNATDGMAVARIFGVKNRPAFDPLIVHVPDLETARQYVEKMPGKAEALANRFWPGPLTMVLKKKPIIPDLVTSGMDTVGIRCPDHALTHRLLKALPFPLAAPSANPFGYVSPTTAQHVNEQLGDNIPYILDGGECNVGIESTIIGMEDEKAVVYRLGGLTLEQIESVIGKVILQPHSTSNPKAPGQLISHYAPSRKVLLGNIPNLIQQYGEDTSAILSFSHDYGVRNQIILSPTGSMEEAAKNLFAALRLLDKMNINFILAELAPDEGLGRAINDRLRRASS